MAAEASKDSEIPDAKKAFRELASALKALEKKSAADKRAAARYTLFAEEVEDIYRRFVGEAEGLADA